MEGDDPLVFGAHLELQKLQDFIENGSRFGPSSRSRKRCREAEGIINNLCKDLVHSRDIWYEELCMLEDELTFIHDQIKDTEIPLSNTGGTLRNKGPRVDYVAIANDRSKMRTPHANTTEHIVNFESEMSAKKAGFGIYRERVVHQ